MGRRDSFTGTVGADPDTVFALVIDVERLPEWNDRILRVVERPARLGAGAEWLVELKILGQRFESRSKVLEIDRASRRIRYRSNPEGDPDYAIWTWQVEPHSRGSSVRVSWDLNPQQFMNRTFWVRVRSRQLKKELPASVAALGRALTERRVLS